MSIGGERTVGGDWTPRRRFEAALHGEMPDRVPTVIWNNKLPGGEINQALLDTGACIVYKSSLYDVELEGIATETEDWVGADGLRHRQENLQKPRSLWKRRL